jgi:hypothetical protein
MQLFLQSKENKQKNIRQKQKQQQQQQQPLPDNINQDINSKTSKQDKNATLRQQLLRVLLEESQRTLNNTQYLGDDFNNVNDGQVEGHDNESDNGNGNDHANGLVKNYNNDIINHQNRNRV